MLEGLNKTHLSPSLDALKHASNTAQKRRETMYTERDAIKEEMEALREERREVHNLYLEVTLHIRKRYDALQNRLREIDERELNRPTPAPVVVHSPRNMDMTGTQLQMERIEAHVSTEDTLVSAVEGFLKENGSSRIKQIRNFLEREHGFKRKNISGVMRQVVLRSEHIGVDQSGKFFKYFYKN